MAAAAEPQANRRSATKTRSFGAMERLVGQGGNAATTRPQCRPAGQVVVTARGAEFRGPRLLHPAGTAERPLDAEWLRAKFRANTAHRLGPGEADALAEVLLDPTTTDVGAVLAELAGAAAA